MDLLRRSFRRSVRRPPREPLTESPSFDSPQEERIPQLASSPMDRLRRSFRRSFRGCGQPRQTLSELSVPQRVDEKSPSVMGKLGRSLRRSFRRKNDEPRELPEEESLPPTYYTNEIPMVANETRRSFRQRKGQIFETPKAPQHCEDDFSEKLKKGLRRSFRRRKESASEMSCKLQYWQSDQMDVRAGTCFFNVKYLGCVEVFEPRGILMCEEAFKMLKKSHKRPIKSFLFVSVNGLKVVEKNTKGLIVDQSNDMLSFCGPVRLHDRGFAFICLNVATRKWMCYCFIAKESGERLSNAVGYAFEIYFERKKKRDKECRVTMNFDLSSATFTRIGSFKRQLMTEKLRDKTNTNDDVDNSAAVAAAQPGTTIININNNITTDLDEDKENIPCDPIHNAKLSHREQMFQSTYSAIRRQQSLRELSRFDQSPSVFRRQASLRLHDLPSNIERVKSLSAEFFDTKTSSAQFLRYRTPISPIAEMSPENVSARLVERRATSSSVRQQLSQKFESSSSVVRKQQTAADFKQVNNLPEEAQHVKRVTVEVNQASQQEASSSNNSSVRSQQASVLSSFESVALTPPATPSPAKVAPVLEPDPWLNKANDTLAATSSEVNLSPLISTYRPSSSSAGGASHGRSHSLSYAEGLLGRSNNPFDIDWTVWTNNVSVRQDEQQQQPKKKKKNTNPFLPSSPDTPEKQGI